MTTDPTQAPGVTPDPAPVPAPEPAPLLGLRDGLPPLVDTDDQLADTASTIAGGDGPVAIDAERASGYRYSNRAYLIQLRRSGSGTHLVDPISLNSLAPLQRALAGTEWILHAATQDLPCLTEIGLVPSSLFDTELAGRLLGYPRVGLATLVEELLGQRMRKEHSAVDWSTRPLPEAWLDYAALDVEVLIELRELMIERLEEAGKLDWARQEFDALLSFQPAIRVEPWRRTSGSHRLRSRRSMAAVRALWEVRDQLARSTDVAPGRILPDSAIVVAAQELPTSSRSLLALKGFHGRGARRYAREWMAALEAARGLPEEQLPGRAPRSDGPPQVRSWADRDPVAAARLAHARAAMAELSERVSVPVENLLTPDVLRRVLWSPPAGDDLATAVASELAALGARPWQVALTGPILVASIESAGA